MNNEEEHPLDKICSVEDFERLHPSLGFNRERFNYILKTKEENGILESGCLVKIGKKYALKYDDFRNWYYRYINIFGRD